MTKHIVDQYVEHKLRIGRNKNRIIGNLQARNVPVLIVANKIDLKKSDIKKIESAFPQYEVIGISAKFGNNLEEFYDKIFNLVK